MRCSSTSGDSREVGADELARELEVPPLAAGLAGEEDHRPLWIAEARDEPVAPLERGRVVVEERLQPGAADARLQLAEQPRVVAEDEDLLAALREPRAQLHERGALVALRDVLAAQHARGERADLDAPVADEPRREAERSARWERSSSAVGYRILAHEELVARRELAQPRERLGVGAAGEEPARDVGVGLVLLEPDEELVERGRGDRLHEREQPEVLARIEAHRRRGEEEDAVGRAAERRDRRVERVVREVVRLVHDDEVERDLGGGVGELRVVAERLGETIA